MFTFLNFNFFILLLYMNVVVCQNGNAEFVVDDQELFYVDQNLTWNEASSLCRSFQSSLITIKEASFASHILEALAAFQAQKLVWIGGRLIHNQWMWKASGLPIQIHGPSFNLPIINNDNSNPIRHQCLAVDTQNFLNPIFVSFNCSDERGLLCQKAQQQPTLLVEEFVYNSHSYAVYEGQSTWQTAVGICNKHNMYLAILSDATEIEEVSLTLASYTHLDINKVWIGGLKDFSSWQWVSTGDAVEHPIENNTNLSKCLVLDIQTQVFYAENCSSGRAFICESRHPDDDFWESFVHQSTEYTIHSLKTTWDKANEICQVDNSFLAVVEDLSDANVIGINMGNSWEVMPIAWLGAKTIQIRSNFVFKWLNSDIEVPLQVDGNGYPPWRNTTVQLSENKCLTLGKSTNKGVSFSSSSCDDAHGFICQRDASVPLAITFTFRVGDKDLLFHDKPETWMKAQEICELTHSRLIIISDPDDLASIKQFTTRHKLWLDGIYEHGNWHWKHDIAELPSHGDIFGLPRINNKHNGTRKCLSIYLQKSRPKFIASSCKAKLPYICERNTQKEQLIKYRGSEYTVINKHLTWHEASALCQARDQNLAETCDTNEAGFLSKLVTAYGDLWLGGIKRETKWIWDAVNVTLPSKTDGKIGYPPWQCGQANRNSMSCLTLTLNSSSHAVFTDRSCNEIRSFICEKYSVQNHKHKFLQPRLSVLDDRQYMFYPQLSTWKDANEECLDNLAFLVIVSTPKIARHIANLTYGHPEIWIGGVFEENEWKWSINGEKIQTWDRKETQWANENEVIEDNSSMQPKYLALNRLNPNIPLFVENEGKEKLGFVCERANNVEEDEYLVEPVPIASGELLFFEDKLNYTDAYDVCQSKNGILVTADTPDLLKIIAKHAKKFHGVWLGATLTSQTQKFLWTHIRKEVTEQIQLITGELLQANYRTKRSANSFREEVLDKSELEEDLKDIYDDVGGEDIDAGEDDDDYNDLLGPWEGSAENKSRNTNDYDEKTNIDFKRSAGNSLNLTESTTRVGDLTSTVPVDSSEEDEDIVLPDESPEQMSSTNEYLVIFKTPSSIDQEFSNDNKGSDLSLLNTSLPPITAKIMGTESTTVMNLETSKTTNDTSVQNRLSINTDEVTLQEHAVTKRTHDDIVPTNFEKENYSKISKTAAEMLSQNIETEKDMTHSTTTTSTSVATTDTTTIPTTTTITIPTTTTIPIPTTTTITIPTTTTTTATTAVLTTTRTIPSTLTTTTARTPISTATTEKPTTPLLEETVRIVNRLLQNLIYCLKMDEDGNLVALNCSSRQSFVCEIRTNNTNGAIAQEFSFKNIDYVISNEKLSWKKAYRKCNKTFGGYLAIFENIEELDFVNNISRDFQDLWIGAKYLDTWTWPYIYHNVYDNTSLWSTLDRHYKCANIYRQHSLQLLLVDRNCTERHGYICKDVSSQIADIEMIGNYTIHWKPSNFFEALTTCAQYDTILASGHEREQVLDIISLKNGVHSVWVSALYLNDNWIWLAESTNFTYKAQLNIEHRAGHECLSIFKRNHRSYSLIDRDCSSRLPFACENVNNRSITYNNNSYTFYLSKQSWWQANDYCASQGQQLAIIKDDQTAAFIKNAALLFDDLWVDGVWTREAKWAWEFTGEIIFEDPLLHYNMKNPSQRITNITKDICLYVENFMKSPGLLSYTLCSVPKAFVCQGVSTNDVASVESIQFNNRTYTIYSEMGTWIEAQEVCSSSGSYLTVMDTMEELVVLNNVKLGNIWVGGRMQYSDMWIWDHTGRKISVEMTPKMDDKIMGLFRGCLGFHKDANNNNFIGVPCNVQLPFVCEEVGHSNKPQARRIDFENEYLVLHNLQLNWNDANDMCVSAGQHLAAITDANAEHFLNLPSEFHDLWVDGRNEDDIWIWTELDTEIETSYDIFRNNSNGLPDSFVRTAPRPNHNCLNLYRPSLNTFAFLDRRCKDEFGFICQGTKYMQHHIKTVVLGGRIYSIYTKKSTWYQANSICKANGTYLAVLNSTEEIELLTQAHVSFVKLWTGALSEDGKWLWDHTGTEIGLNMYTRFLNTTDQCGILKRSHKGGIALLPKNCSLLYAFVCEERGDQGKWTSEALNISGHYYSIYSERAIWSHASDICTENGQYLALIDTDDEMQAISQLNMDFHDLWVGARRVENSNKWEWIHTGQQLSFDEKEPNRPKIINKTVQNSCLNIYREWNSDSLLIDRDCNEQHGYICESVPISKHHVQVVRTAFGGHSYVLIQHRLTWLQAYQACDKFNGYLAIVSSQSEADFLASINPAFHDLWIGGSNFNNSPWKWYYTGQKIPEDLTWERKPTRKNYNCLNLYASEEQTGILIDRKCSEVNSFVCEETTTYQEIKESDYSNLNDIDGFEKAIFNDFVFPTDPLPNYKVFKGRKYMFSSVRLTFDTAVETCRRHFGHLAILDDPAEMEFIGNNSEGFHNLWIDGKLVNGKWVWEHLGTIISPEKFVDYRGRVTDSCLTFYRQDDTTSYFVDRKCEEKHSFVCKDVIQETREVQEEFLYNERYYLLFPNAQLTWFEADIFCKQQSGYLAIVDDSEEAAFLASLGNDLWLDAKFEDNKNAWQWNHIQKEIRFEDYTLKKYSPLLKDSKGSKCLNLFLGVNGTPGFVERNCEDRFGLVCEDLIALPSGENVLSMKYDDRNFVFVKQHLSWQEAFDKCRKNGGYLAIISMQEEAKFIAKMANKFHDMWIDGVFKDNIWVNNYTGQNIAVYPYSDENTTADGDSIQWTTLQTRPGFNCLNAYLPSSETLMFVGRNCSEKHTFVCEEVIEEPTLPETIEFNGIRYTINMEPVSWEEANKRCRHHGYLAIIDTIDEASGLVKAIGRFHSLWIGAQFNREDWIWNYTGEVIDPDTNLWMNAVPRTNLNCSILYRNNFMVPFIVDQACDDKFGYICEEGESWGDPEPTYIVRHDGKMYTFYGNRLTWNDAKKYCESTTATLAVINDLRLATLLTQQQEYYDFWIDGISEALLWTWSSTGIYLKRFEVSDIKYVRIIPRSDPSCLALFRSNNTVRYLDDNCNIAKPFLCQKYDSLLSGNVTMVKRNNTQYYLVNGVKKTWFEAWEICAANGSYLPIVKDAETAEFVASLYSYKLGEIWLGARKLSNWWTWELTEETLLEAETEIDFPVWSHLNQPDNMCLGLDHRTTMYSVFTDLNCSTSKAVICEQGCPALPKINGTWTRKECTLRVQKVGEQCKLKCKFGYLPAGVPNLTCTANSWSSVIPICLSVRDFSLSIVSNVKNALNSFKPGYEREPSETTKKNIGLLFLIDTSSGVGWENYQNILEVVKSVSVGVGASGKNIFQGVISFEAEAKLEFGFRNIDTCSFIQHVDKMAYKPNSDVVSFKKVFEVAHNVLERNNAFGSSVIFIIASNNSTEELDYDLFNIKQNGNIVVVIGIKPQVTINLVQQLASPGSLKYQWNINYFELNEVAYVLNRTFLYSGKLACCMRLRNTNGLSVSPPSCIRDVSQKNSRCSIQCDSQYHLQGIETLMCTSDGWQSTLDLKRPFPECYTMQQVTLAFLKTVKLLYEDAIVDSTLFLIDQSGSMSEDDFSAEISFVKQFLRIGSTKIGVIVFSSEAYVEIPLAYYKESDSLCELYDHLDKLRFSGGSTNYEKAFAASYREIHSYMSNCSHCSHQRTLIGNAFLAVNNIKTCTVCFTLVMITDGQNSDTIEFAEKLKSQGHIIVILSIAVSKRRNLMKIVSNSEESFPLLFSLNTFGDLRKMNAFINSKLLENSTLICCRIPEEFQKSQSKLFVLQNDVLDVTCPPGYALSVENSTLTCTEIGLNVNPTCFAVPRKIAEYINIQFYHILNRFVQTKQLVVFLIDQTETMTPEKNTQSVTFVKSTATLLGLSENRTVGLINGQNHEAVMLIEPNITCPDKFSALLNNVTFNSTSYSLYKPLKYILENLIANNVNVLTVIISDRIYISTPSLKLARKIMSSNNNIYVIEVHNETIESNVGGLVENRKDFFISGYYMLKDNLYSVDSFETLEAVAENIYLT